MRQSLAVGLGLFACALAGCLTGETQRTSSRYPPDPAAPAAAVDAVELVFAVIERPVGDRYLNGEAWEMADEQRIAPPEGADPELRRKQALEDNGFRVGQIGGILPPGLQKLLDSGRSCAQPRRICLAAGSATPVLLGPIHPTLTVHPGGAAAATEDLELTRAQCELLVTSTLVSEGRIRLLFTPTVRHGSPDLAPRPLQDPDGTRRWELQSSQTVQRWEALSWALTVGPDEVVMVGPRTGQGDTLGNAFFVQADGEAPVQRLFVLRANRCPSDRPSEDTVRRSASAALRAGQPGLGGVEP